jgi:hypothetical protein
MRGGMRSQRTRKQRIDGAAKALSSPWTMRGVEHAAKWRKRVAGYREAEQKAVQSVGSTFPAGSRLVRTRERRVRRADQDCAGWRLAGPRELQSLAGLSGTPSRAGVTWPPRRTHARLYTTAYVAQSLGLSHAWGGEIDARRSLVLFGFKITITLAFTVVAGVFTGPGRLQVHRALAHAPAAPA